MELLAQMHSAQESGGSLTLTILYLVAMIIPFIVLGVVCWIFWQAKKREDEAVRRIGEWRNVHSS